MHGGGCAVYTSDSIVPPPAKKPASRRPAVGSITDKAMYLRNVPKKASGWMPLSCVGSTAHNPALHVRDLHKHVTRNVGSHMVQ